jgi:uncharacterized metal-binding protein
MDGLNKVVCEWGRNGGKMSKGVVHSKASLALSGGFLLYGLFTWDISGIAYAAGSLIGVMVQPDCDVNGGHIADKYIRNKIGWFAEKMWDGIWLFYRNSVKHGSELSHGPILGTIGRIIYLYFLFIVVPHFIYYFVFNPQWDLWYVLNWYVDRIVENYRIVLGLAGADFIHFVLDICTVEHGKKRVTNGTQNKTVRRNVRDSIRDRLPNSGL